MDRRDAEIFVDPLPFACFGLVGGALLLGALHTPLIAAADGPGAGVILAGYTALLQAMAALVALAQGRMRDGQALAVLAAAWLAAGLALVAASHGNAEALPRVLPAAAAATAIELGRSLKAIRRATAMALAATMVCTGAAALHDLGIAVAAPATAGVGFAAAAVLLATAAAVQLGPTETGGDGR